MLPKFYSWQHMFHIALAANHLLFAALRHANRLRVGNRARKHQGENDEKQMNMQIVSAKDYGEGRTMLETGRAVAYMMDDVLLAGTRSLTSKPSDWVIVGTPQSSEAYGFMMRKVIGGALSAFGAYSWNGSESWPSARISNTLSVMATSA
jgi:hypothetical protein